MDMEKKTRQLLAEYNLSDQDVLEKFIFRDIEHSEMKQVVMI